MLIRNPQFRTDYASLLTPRRSWDRRSGIGGIFSDPMFYLGSRVVKSHLLREKTRSWPNILKSALPTLALKTLRRVRVPEIVLE